MSNSSFSAATNAQARRTDAADSSRVAASVEDLQQRIEGVQRRIAKATAELTKLTQQLGHAQWLHEYETTEAARSPSRR